MLPFKCISTLWFWIQKHCLKSKTVSAARLRFGPHPPCRMRSISLEPTRFARLFSPSRPTHALHLSPSFGWNKAAVRCRFRVAPPVALPVCHGGGIRVVAPWLSLPLDWSQPILHLISPLNFETVSHWRPPLHSAPPSRLTAPAYKRCREHPLPPPHPIPPPVLLLHNRVALAPSFTTAVCSSPPPTLPRRCRGHWRPWWGSQEPPLHFGESAAGFGAA
jgi:hypothetical protein